MKPDRTTPLDSEEAALARLLATSGGAEPPAALDIRIRSQAHAAVRRRPLRAWGGALAAVLALGVGIRLNLAPDALQPPAVPSEHSIRSVDQQASPSIADAAKQQAAAESGAAGEPHPADIAPTAAIQSAPGEAGRVIEVAPAPAPRASAAPAQERVMAAPLRAEEEALQPSVQVPHAAAPAEPSRADPSPTSPAAFPDATTSRSLAPAPAPPPPPEPAAARKRSAIELGDQAAESKSTAGNANVGKAGDGDVVDAEREHRASSQQTRKSVELDVQEKSERPQHQRPALAPTPALGAQTTQSVESSRTGFPEDLEALIAQVREAQRIGRADLLRDALRQIMERHPKSELPDDVRALVDAESNRRP